MRRLLRWLGSCMLSCCCICLHAQEALPEADVKAAFLYNFSLLTEWPNLPENEVIVCRFIKDQIDINHSLLEQKNIEGRPFKWQIIDSMSELRGCQVAVFGQYKTEEIDSILASLNNAPVLTVSDARSPQAQKAMIAIVHEQHLLGFEVNLKASKSANLKLSAKLLRLAKRVNATQ